MRAHFAICPKRPAASENVRVCSTGSPGAICAHFTICAKRPAASDDVKRRGTDPRVKGGRPSGWNAVRLALRSPTHRAPHARALRHMREAAGSLRLTASQMHSHFTICANRPTRSDHVDGTRVLRVADFDTLSVFTARTRKRYEPAASLAKLTLRCSVGGLQS